MNRNRWYLLALSALAPVSVQLHAKGDTVATITAADGTRIEVFGGTGEYAFITRGCEGSILNTQPISFREVAGAVEQQLGSSGVSAGVRGGWMRDDLAGWTANPDPYGGGTTTPVEYPRFVVDNRYINPYFTYESPGGSVGFGWIWHDEEFITAGEGARKAPDHPLNDISAHIRIGPDRKYFAVRWMEGVPLYSSGGYLQIGMGGRPNDGAFSVYGGMGTGGPYEGAGTMFQAGYRFPNGLTASARTRLGFSGNHNASGVSLGVGYNQLRP